MNDPLRLEHPGGFRNAVYVQIFAMFVFGVTIVWYGSQIEARLDARVSALERQQTLSQTVIDRLNDAREENRIHGAQVDDKLTEMTGQLGAILGIIQQDPQNGGNPNGGAKNFHPSSSKNRE